MSIKDELTESNIADLRRIDQNGVLNSTKDENAMITLEYVVGNLLSDIDEQQEFLTVGIENLFQGNETVH